MAHFNWPSGTTFEPLLIKIDVLVSQIYHHIKTVGNLNGMLQYEIFFFMS